MADDDRRARFGPRAEHLRTHARPSVDEFGVLRHDEAIVFLSPREQAIAEILIENFGAVVRDETLLVLHASGESDMRRETLRTHTSRLRKRIAPLGLTVSCIRNVGYMMHHDTGAES